MNKESLTIAIAQSYLDMLAPAMGRLPADVTLETFLNYKLPDDEPRTFNAVVTVWRDKMDRCSRMDIEFIGEVKEPQEPQPIISPAPKKQPLNQVLEALRQSEDWEEYDHFCQLLLNRIARLEGF